MRRVALEVLSTHAVSRHAVIAAVDPNRALVKVQWDAEGTLSGWLPVAQLAAGNGWSAVCLPLPGTQVFCTPDSGDSGSMVVTGAVHSSQQPPGKITPYQAQEAVPLVPGEPTFMHVAGASFRLTAGGVIEMRGTVKVAGDLIVSGDVIDRNGVHGSLDVLREAYNQHDHAQSVGLTTKPTP